MTALGGIRFQSNLEGLSPGSVKGFFVGWPNPPTPEMLLKLLTQSDYRWVAIDVHTGNCVGYVTAVGDGVLFSFISSLEVLPEFQGHGIGSELIRLICIDLEQYYATDIVCDADFQPFYEKYGFSPCSSMVIRRRAKIESPATGSRPG